MFIDETLFTSFLICSCNLFCYVIFVKKWVERNLIDFQRRSMKMRKIFIRLLWVLS